MTTPMATGWETVGTFGGLPWTRRAVTGATTAGRREVLEVTTGASDAVITPPASPGVGDEAFVIKVDAGAGAVKWNGPTQSDVDARLVGQWTGARLWWNGTLWLVLGVNVAYSGPQGMTQSAGDARYAQLSDTRLTDARAPLAHKASHALGGSDVLSPADIGAAPAAHSHALGDLPASLVVTSDARLSDSRAPLAHSAALITSGTLGYARLPVGTAASTVAAGDDGRFTNARTPTAHAASHATGGGDAITPAAIGAAATAHSHSGADITTGTVPYARLPIGTAASTVAAGDDSRLTNARTPTAHASSHAAGGSDVVTPAAIGAQATSGKSTPTALVPNGYPTVDASGLIPNGLIYAAGGSGAWGITRIGTGAAVDSWVAAGDHAHNDKYVDFWSDQALGGIKTFTTGVRIPQPDNAAAPVRNDDSRLGAGSSTPPAAVQLGNITGTVTLNPALGDVFVGSATGNVVFGTPAAGQRDGQQMRVEVYASAATRTAGISGTTTNASNRALPLSLASGTCAWLLFTYSARAGHWIVTAALQE